MRPVRSLLGKATASRESRRPLAASRQEQSEDRSPEQVDGSRQFLNRQVDGVKALGAREMRRSEQVNRRNRVIRYKGILFTTC
jgi:hypothetical protein